MRFPLLNPDHRQISQPAIGRFCTAPEEINFGKLIVRNWWCVLDWGPFIFHENVTMCTCHPIAAPQGRYTEEPSLTGKVLSMMCIGTGAVYKAACYMVNKYLLFSTLMSVATLFFCTLPPLAAALLSALSALCLLYYGIYGAPSVREWYEKMGGK